MSLHLRCGTHAAVILATFALGLACVELFAEDARSGKMTIHSKILDRDETFVVWLPPNYGQDAERRFPVMYLLQNPGFPQKRCEALWKAGNYDPAIAVLCDVDKGGTAWSNVDFPTEDYFIRELIPHIDATYRTLADRTGRSVLGCSKAGGGCLRIGLKYPEMFSAIISLDGWMTLYDTRTNRGNKPDLYVGESYFDFLQQHGKQAQAIPLLLIEGSMFTEQIREYEPRWLEAGMTDVRRIDAREYTHNCAKMHDIYLEEILTTYQNGRITKGPRPPASNVAPGYVIEPFDLELRMPDGADALYFTTDGSQPTRSSTEYRRPIQIGSNTIVRARAFVGDTGGREACLRYTFLSSPKCQPLTTRPTDFKPGLVLQRFERDPEVAWPKNGESPFAGPPQLTEIVSNIGIRETDQGQDHFGYKITGFLQVPRTAVYDFESWGDDRLEVVIGDSVRFSSRTKAVLQHVALRKGLYPISIYYGEAQHNERFGISWALHGEESKPIPDDAWFHE